MNERACPSIGPHRSVSDETIDFKGRHQDKQKIKHKCEGYIFMVDYYCDNGFACSFNFMNMPTPTNHMRLKLSTFHNRVLGLFAALLNSDYDFCVDNLSVSVKFLVQSLKDKVHEIVEGACIKGSRFFLDTCK